jgi:hypothetical protein
MNRSKEQEAFMLQMIEGGKLKVGKVPHNQDWAVNEKRNQITQCIDSIESNKKNPQTGFKPKPNLILQRLGQEMIVLKWANFTIAGFPIGKNDKIEALKWVRDVWLEEPESQELIYSVHQEMTRTLMQRRRDKTEEVH